MLGAALTLAMAGCALAAPATPVVMTTDLGVVELELYPDKAPVTVANFLRYVDEGRFDGATFYAWSAPGPTRIPRRRSR